MATSTFTLFFLLLPLISGITFVMADMEPSRRVVRLRTWCIAKPSSSDETLSANLNYSCYKVDCKDLQKGGPCFNPDNLINHASIAMNLYYVNHNKSHQACDFRGSGLVTLSDPSYEDCVY